MNSHLNRPAARCEPTSQDAWLLQKGGVPSSSIAGSSPHSPTKQWSIADAPASTWQAWHNEAPEDCYLPTTVIHNMVALPQHSPHITTQALPIQRTYSRQEEVPPSPIGQSHSSEETSSPFWSTAPGYVGTHHSSPQSFPMLNPHCHSLCIQQHQQHLSDTQFYLSLQNCFVAPKPSTTSRAPYDSASAEYQLDHVSHNGMLISTAPHVPWIQNERSLLPSLRHLFVLPSWSYSQRLVPYENARSAPEQTIQQRVARLAFYLWFNELAASDLSQQQSRDGSSALGAADPATARVARRSNATMERRIRLKLTSQSSMTFPMKLHRLLSQASQDGREDIVSWSASGAFKIHSPARFMSELAPDYFNQNKWASFRRQLSLYRFDRVPRGPHEGFYQHGSFRRDQPDLAQSIKRVENAKELRDKNTKLWQPDERDFDM